MLMWETVFAANFSTAPDFLLRLRIPLIGRFAHAFFFANKGLQDYGCIIITVLAWPFMQLFRLGYLVLFLVAKKSGKSTSYLNLKSGIKDSESTAIDIKYFQFLGLTYI